MGQASASIAMRTGYKFHYALQKGGPPVWERYAGMPPPRWPQNP